MLNSKNLKQKLICVSLAKASLKQISPDTFYLKIKSMQKQTAKTNPGLRQGFVLAELMLPVC